MTEAASKPLDIDGAVRHTHIGGQAVLEGIMMRGRYNWAVAVRTPDGAIHAEEHDLASGAAKSDWMRWPIVRGCVAMVETLSLAMKAFTVSASLAGESEDEQLSTKEIALTMVFGVGLAVLFFIVLPAVLTNLVAGSAIDHPFRWSMIDGLLRVVAFFGYIWAIARMQDIQRVFAYHGAEHKTIHAYEHDLPLEPGIIQRFQTLHIRCGTSFLLMVMVVAIIVFSLTPVRAIAALLHVSGTLPVLGIAIAVRLLLMPLVAGLAYEITVKWAGSHSENRFVQLLLWPGLQLQRMTTREPDDSMIEVAVAAMRPIIAREDREERIAKGLPAEEPVDSEVELAQAGSTSAGLIDEPTLT